MRLVCYPIFIALVFGGSPVGVSSARFPRAKECKRLIVAIRQEGWEDADDRHRVWSCAGSRRDVIAPSRSRACQGPEPTENPVITNTGLDTLRYICCGLFGGH